MLVHQLPRARKYIWLFGLWVAFAFGSAIMVLCKENSPVHLLACIRTYCIFPLYLLIGWYLITNLQLRKSAMRIVILGVVIAVIIAFVQEFYRDALPAVLSQRIYKDKHSLAAGMYVESIFASPKVASSVFLFIFYLCEGLYVRGSGRRAYRNACLLLMALLLGAIYVSRYRTALVCALFGGAGLLVLLMHAHKRRCIQRPAGGRLVIAMVLALALCIGYFMCTTGPDASVSLENIGEMRYYSDAFNVQNIIARPHVALSETRQIGVTLLGSGAGTLGKLCALLGDESRITDAGIALLVGEFGMLGAIIFVATNMILLWLVLSGHRRVSNGDLAIYMCCVMFSGIMFLEFIFKISSNIENGLILFMWYASAGAALALAYGREGACLAPENWSVSYERFPRTYCSCVADWRGRRAPHG